MERLESRGLRGGESGAKLSSSHRRRRVLCHRRFLAVQCSLPVRLADPGAEFFPESNLRSEVVNPARNFRRVIVGGVFFVIVVFLLFNAVCLYVLPIRVLSSSLNPTSDLRW